ncbi:MAG: immunoglobulin-like domain-containing protein, partial [Clostridium paraputrificum]
MKKEKVIALIICGSLISSTLLQPLDVYAYNLDSGNKYSDTSITSKIITDSPDFNISTNITHGKIFNINENLTMTFNMDTELDKKIIKKGDKIKIQLPPGGISNYILDASEPILSKTNITFEKDSGEFIIEFTDNITSTGNSKFRINFVVAGKQITDYEIKVNFERETESKPLSFENNIFNSKEEDKFTYRLLSPYWNTEAQNYIGQTPDNRGLFLSTDNKASFFIDINGGYNLNIGTAFTIAFQLDNQRLLKESLRLIRYDGRNDVVGTDVSHNISFEDGVGRDGFVRVHTPEANINTKYRLYFDTEILNVNAPIVSQFYGNSLGTGDDKYYPILYTEMTNKISDSDYIPIIFGPTRETLKIGSTFNEKNGMSAFDEEDGDITNEINVISNNVNPNKEGTYKVIYEVTDTKGNTVRLTKTVLVTSDNPPVINGVINHKIFVGDTSFNPMAGVTATDQEDGIITNRITVIGNVDINTPGKYQIMYEVTDRDGNKAQASSIVTVVTNDKPVIKANNVTIKENTPINLLTDDVIGLTATDTEDGNITNKVTVKNDGGLNVNDPQPGTYSVTYTVTDRDNNTTDKTITVTVNPKLTVINKVPIITANNKVIKVGDVFNPLEGVTAHDDEDGDIKLTEDNVIENTVNVNNPGTYKVVYEVTDSQGAKTRKTITVVVNPKMEELNHIPTINATDKVLTVGDTFNPLDGVTAHDTED